MKAVILPMGVDGLGDVLLAPTSAAKPWHVVIADLICGQRVRQRVDIVERVAARSRKAADIGDSLDPGGAEDVDEVLKAVIGMSDRGEAGHVSFGSNLPSRP